MTQMKGAETSSAILLKGKTVLSHMKDKHKRYSVRLACVRRAMTVQLAQLTVTQWVALLEVQLGHAPVTAMPVTVEMTAGQMQWSRLFLGNTL